MSEFIRIQQVFNSRAQAQAFLDSVKREAWPHAWCTQDRRSRLWRVTALLDTSRFDVVSMGSHHTAHGR